VQQIGNKETYGREMIMVGDKKIEKLATQLAPTKEYRFSQSILIFTINMDFHNQGQNIMALFNHKPWMNMEHGIGGKRKWRKEWWSIATRVNVLLLGEPPNKNSSQK
jgi:hypothetical protein